MAEQDVLSEMLTGEKGSIRCIGKFYIMPTRSEIDGRKLTLFAGALTPSVGQHLVSPECEKHSEMWEAEIIIIPKRKYSSKYKTTKKQQTFGVNEWAFNGYRVDQVICGRYGDPDCWGEEYFEAEARKDKDWYVAKEIAELQAENTDKVNARASKYVKLAIEAGIEHEKQKTKQFKAQVKQLQGEIKAIVKTKNSIIGGLNQRLSDLGGQC